MNIMINSMNIMMTFRSTIFIFLFIVMEDIIILKSLTIIIKMMINNEDF